MNSESITAVPSLQTERLLVRAYRREDFDAFAAHLANPVAAAHLGANDRQAAWRIFCSQAGLWLIHGAGWWSIEERETGRLAGNVGAFFREDATVMELGWNTYRAFGGRGYASEAAAAALHHALAIRCEPKVRAVIAADNASSLRVAERLGLAYEAETEIYGKAVGIYARGRSDSAECAVDSGRARL